MSVDLNKKVSLVKAKTDALGINPNFKLAVKTCIDVSGSMSGLFSDGTVQKVVDRLLAVAVRFDDNQSIESYAFASKTAQLSPVTPNDFGDYVNRKFIKEATDKGVMWGGTSYDRAFQMIGNDSGGSKGFFGMGAKKPEPTYLLFITDGDTSDERSAEAELVKLGDKNHYVHLIGIGRGSRFSWLRTMADKYDFVGFATFPDIERITDEQMYDTLLTGELATWISRR